MSRRIWDISQVLRPDLPVWPGDTAFQREDTWTISDSCPVKVSRLTLSTHSGTHADAPEHYGRQGVDIASVGLEPYLGPCSLVTSRGDGLLVNVDDIDCSALAYPERVLIRTYERFPHQHWDSNFRALHPDLVDELAARGCRLVGTDSASLDPETAKHLAAHKRVEAHDMRILEGLVLDDIADGDYELIALPLPIQHADASPVRAILRDLP